MCAIFVFLFLHVLDLLSFFLLLLILSYCFLVLFFFHFLFFRLFFLLFYCFFFRYIFFFLPLLFLILFLYILLPRIFLAISFLIRCNILSTCSILYFFLLFLYSFSSNSRSLFPSIVPILLSCLSIHPNLLVKRL